MKTPNEIMLLRKDLSKIMIFFGIGIVCLSLPLLHSLHLFYFGFTLLLGGLFFYIAESVDYKNLEKKAGE